jgi:hypothetical protein
MLKSKFSDLLKSSLGYHHSKEGTKSSEHEKP